MRVRSFSKVSDQYPLPNLVDIQTKSYEDFLQLDVAPRKRKNHGLETILRESFPIMSHDGSIRLEYICYELGKPRYSADECRKLRLSYGMPFRIWARLHKSQGEAIEEEVYLGEVPIMMGGGEFVINGAERVIVSQLHRSPGIDFLMELATGGRKLHSCRIIPERGSWIEMDVTKKDILAVRIDQSGKFSVTMFLRAMDEKYSTDADILRMFYETEKVKIADSAAPKTKKKMRPQEPAKVVDELYELLAELPRFNAEAKKEDLPQDGIYFLFEKGEKVDWRGKKADRVVYVGINTGEKTPLWKRIVKDRFRAGDDEDTFLASVARAALAKKSPGDARIALKRPLKNDEGTPKTREIVRDCLKGFTFCCLPVDQKRERRTLESAIIALLAQHPIGAPSEKWLGLADPMNSGDREQSGLWNEKGTGGRALTQAELQRLYNLAGVSGRLGSEEQGSQEELVPIPSGLAKLKGCVPIEDVVHPETGEVLVGPRDDKDPALDAERIQTLKEVGIKEIEVIKDLKDPLILNTIRQDNSVSHDDALKRIFQRLRPGNPANPEKAKQLFHDKFFDSDRYRLGAVGRFRLNRKFEQNVPETDMTLRPEDIVQAIDYILKLRLSEGTTDDIDHLGNRRLRTIDELAGDELRKGFLKLRHTVRERMSLKDPDEMTPRSLINSKTISSAMDFFFGRSELSQVVDQTNPLSQLSHERRLSALGPGGLNRKRASFEVRDVHISHYGRICPIETPEGTNIGLIANLSLFATVDKYGFIITPYRVVKSGRVTGEIKFLRADEEEDRWIAPADVPTNARKKIAATQVLARYNGEFILTTSRSVQYMDISPKQMLGISAALIPFLEHDDANRALMGSNMQRQAVPLMTTEPPLVGTGVERDVALHSGMVVQARQSGKVTAVDADHIVLDDSELYPLRKFVGLNERTCLTQKPLVRPGDTVKTGQVIADGAGTHNGELALGRNVLVAFMIWDGYNFEDAIIISERLVKDDVYTSVHIEEFEVEIRETKLGREEFTRDIPNVSERQLRNLNEEGIISIGTHIEPGDILVGKVSPKSKSELSPEEKLLHAIFGRAGEDVKNESLEVPPGVDGVVIDAQKFSRKAYMSDDKRKELDRSIAKIEREANAEVAGLFRKLMADLEKVNGDAKLKTQAGETLTVKRDMTDVEVCRMEELFDIDAIKFSTQARSRKASQIFSDAEEVIDQIKDEKDRQVNHLKRGDELPSGVLEMVKVYVATKRKLSVGDKMAGRHGNKGVIAKILPIEDMPYLDDGTPVDIILNPLGVPSRMNLGQILETHLGWAAKILGFQAITPPFDGCTETEIRELLKSANLPEDGKVVLYDGRTGESFEQKVTVGQICMMKLHHLVDDKIHARSTGPYSLITQQPLGGKARMGGQRFGEMEVWALEAYGAAHVLQEMLTAKSDDVEGRTKIYESMVKGTNTLEAGTPVSFDVLCNEIRGLGLNMQLEKKTVLD